MLTPVNTGVRNLAQSNVGMEGLLKYYNIVLLSLLGNASISYL